MIQNIKKILTTTFAAALLFAAPVGLVGVAHAAEIESNLCGGASNLQLDSAGSCDDGAGSTGGVNELITRVINIFSAIVGIIAVVMIIYGGLRYITSGGDSGKVTSAKNTIIYAVIGLIVVALAQFIVQFVLNKATNI